MLLIRSLAYLIALGLLGLSGYLGLGLYDRLTADPAETDMSAQAGELAALAGAEAGSDVTGDLGRRAVEPRRWAALFGEPQPPAPPTRQEPAPEPQPPNPPSPPLESMGYSLKGVVSSGVTQWAIVSHPAGDVILRYGEELTAGLHLLAITKEGLVLGPKGAQPQDPSGLQEGDAQKLLRFPE